MKSIRNVITLILISALFLTLMPLSIAENSDALFESFDELILEDELSEQIIDESSLEEDSQFLQEETFEISNNEFSNQDDILYYDNTIDDFQFAEQENDNVIIEPEINMASNETFYDVSSAGQALKSHLKNHTSEIRITLSLPSENWTYIDWKTMWNSIRSQAYAHTGIPTEGDYLRYECVSGYTLKGTGPILNGDRYIYQYNMSVSFTNLVNEAEVDGKVNSILGQLALHGKSDYEKIEMIYRYLCENVSFSSSMDRLQKPCYTALIQGSSASLGFALSFYRLCLEAGVYNVRVISSVNMQHSWNIVQIQNKYYMLDSSLDAGSSFSNWNWFLCGTEKWNSEHWINGYSELGDEYNESNFASLYPLSSVDYINENIDIPSTPMPTPTQTPAPTPTQTPAPTPTSAPSPTTTPLPDNKDQLIVGFVSRSYEQIMGRAGDEDGIQFWKYALKTGNAAGADIVSLFCSSDEFRNKNLDAENVVGILYSVMLNRTPDAGGIAYWTDMLGKGVSCNMIISGFAGSDEFAGICAEYGINPGTVETEIRDQNPMVTAFVSRCYQYAMGRQGDAGGLNHWAGILLNHIMTPQEVSFEFLNSAEFKAMGLNNVDYITTLYYLYMDREPDSGGLEYWIVQLASGVSRETAAQGFAGSAEFTGIVQSYGLG